MAVLAICLCFVNIQPVYAEEVTDDLEAEIAEKKAAGIEVHELVSDDGKVMGYFLPNAEMDEREAKTTRGSFNWKTAPNTDLGAITIFLLLREIGYMYPHRKILLEQDVLVMWGCVITIMALLAIHLHL
jgi:hypothetical protein